MKSYRGRDLLCLLIEDVAAVVNVCSFFELDNNVLGLSWQLRTNPAYFLVIM